MFDFTTSETYTVKFFHSAKGYGFLRSPEGDVIVHHSEIVGQSGYRTLWEDDVVEATIVRGKRGLEARNVRLVSKGPRLKREPLVVSK